MRRELLTLGAVAAGAAGWGWFEAGWVRLHRVAVPLDRLPAPLEGLRIMHLSDFHLGLPSRGEHAVERAVEWAEQLEPELTVITGDLLSRPSGEPLLRSLLPRLPNCYAVLGNHDYARSRDPFSKPAVVRDIAPATLLRDEARTVDLHGRRVQIVGVDPETFWHRRARPAELADATADLRILLCHYPGIVGKIPPGAFDLILCGHLHGGQISLPYGLGKLRLAHLRGPYHEGMYRTPTGVLHISRGLGTTFVPFRFFARPEATELVLVQP